jgi:aconitate hydratase
MGVLPLQFLEGTNAQSLGLNGSERYSVAGLNDSIRPGQNLTLQIKRANGETQEVPAKLRIDTAIEIDYYQHGGILPFVLRELLAR